MILRLDQNTTLHLVDIRVEEDKRSLLDLVIGAFQSFSRSPHSLGVSTPYLNAVGSKIFLADMLGLAKIPPALSLAVTTALLAAGVIWSLIKTRPNSTRSVGGGRSG